MSLYATNDFDLCKCALDYATRTNPYPATFSSVGLPQPLKSADLIQNADIILEWLRENCAKQ